LSNDNDHDDHDDINIPIEQKPSGYNPPYPTPYSKKAQLFQYRREMIQDLASKGHSERQIAVKLQMSQPTVHRDLSVLRQKAKRNITRYIDEELPNEFHNCLRGLNMILQQAWKMSLDEKADRKEKITAMILVKDCYQMKLDLLSSATVVDRAVKFVEKHRGSIDENDRVRVLDQYIDEGARAESSTDTNLHHHYDYDTSES